MNSEVNKLNVSIPKSRFYYKEEDFDSLEKEELKL
jgi:hypothetical protein